MDADPSIFADGTALEGPPDDDLVRSVEAELGVVLPAAYVGLSRIHNGGYLARDAYPSPSTTRGRLRRRHLGDVGRDVRLAGPADTSVTRV